MSTSIMMAVSSPTPGNAGEDAYPLGHLRVAACLVCHLAVDLRDVPLNLGEALFQLRAADQRYRCRRQARFGRGLILDQGPAPPSAFP